MSQFKDKKIGIIGLSVEGIDSVKFFSKHGASITCCDMRTRTELGVAYEELQEYNVQFQLGKKYLSGMSNYDIVMRTPGISPHTKEIQEAKKNGVHISSNAKMFFSLCKGTIIGVTGTKGKGTTSTLIYHMLKRAKKHAYLGGNVGTPLLSKTDDISVHDWVVVELSSFQLEDFEESPHVAVVLRITQEHLANFDSLATNYHKTRDDYVYAKQPICKYQTQSDVIIVHGDDKTSTSFGNISKAKTKMFGFNSRKYDAHIVNETLFIQQRTGIKRVCSLSEIHLPGIHNLENIAAASLAVMHAGCSLEDVLSVAKKFSGLEHRIELVRELNGVRFYNDSFSTIPETTLSLIHI